MSNVPERFLKSSTYLGEIPSGALLLNGNACYPWFIIVPHGDFTEWIELPMELQQSLLTDINVLSAFLKGRDGVEKINIASIGNIVPQFHLHVLGRSSSDPAWPGPVWGHPDSKAYEEGAIEDIVDRLGAALDQFVPA